MRAGRGPRALLTVCPDPQPDVGAVLTALLSEWHIEFVWETKDGTIKDVTVDESQYQELAALVADARAARALSLYTDVPYRPGWGRRVASSSTDSVMQR